MTLGSNSGLSIGTTTAAAANGLLVAGAATFSSSVAIGTGATIANDITWTNDTGYGLKAQDGTRYLSYTTAGGTILGSTGSAKTIIQGNGGIVLIGTTTVSGASVLQVQGAATFSSSVTATAFIPSGATVPTNGMYLSAANTLNFATASTNRLTIGSTGAASFSSTVSLTDELIFLGASVNTSIKTFGSTNRDRLRIRAYNEVNIDSDVLLTFSTGGSTRVIIDSSGRTSIGYTTNPSIYQLDVNGTGRFSGALTGTSATFSSSVQADGSGNGFLINQNGGAAGLATYSANSDRAQISFKYAQNYPASNNYTRVLDIVSTGDATGGGMIRLFTTVNNSTPSAALTLASTGVATFSSDVILSAANPFVYGGTSVGGVGISNISGSSYIKIYAASHATLANNIQFVNASSTSFLISNTGAATFSANVQIGSATTASGLSQLTVGNLLGYAALKLSIDATKYSWIAGAQYNVDNGFEITPSTAVGGSTFTTPVFKITQAGAATFSSTLGIGGVADSVKGGTYTPTLTNASNITSSALSASYPTKYIRVGNKVTVSGFVNITPTTAANFVQLTLTLPVASSTSTYGTLNGTAVVSGDQAPIWGLVSPSTNIAYINFANLLNNQYEVYYTFTYDIT
jgi:hypothetical protein